MDAPPIVDAAEGALGEAKVAEKPGAAAEGSAASEGGAKQEEKKATEGKPAKQEVKVDQDEEDQSPSLSPEELADLEAMQAMVDGEAGEDAKQGQAEEGQAEVD